MNQQPPTHEVYPKRYWDASPTWKQWNKITAADVHALRFERGFEGQNIYFHLNHPIQYIRIVCILLEIELAGGGKYVLLSLDDGSGACITVKVDRRNVASNDGAEYPSNTTVDNVNVHVNLGNTTVYIDNNPVEVGTIIKSKGLISTFRDVRQLDLKRVTIVRDTNEEVAAWADTARWKRDVLSQPWVLTKTQRDEIDANILSEQQRNREKAKRKKEWHASHAVKRRRHEEKHEAKRKAREVMYNDGALLGSDVVKAPWD